MPDDVSCPNPPVLIHEVVTRRILAEVLEQQFDDQFVRLSEDVSRQLGANEEKRKLERAQEYRAVLEDMRDVVRAMFDEHLPLMQNQISDHEQRLVRLEARPAKRVRKSAKTRRKPK
jgi:hypothetical protein